jgi:acyl carrier protein
MTEISFAAVVERIGTLTPLPARAVTPQTLLRDLVRESFALVELTVDLQEEFTVYFTQRELSDVATLGDLTALLNKSLAARRQDQGPAL